jgi:hypothetical protein
MSDNDDSKRVQDEAHADEQEKDKPADQQEQPKPAESTLQTSGPCKFKDLCRGHGKMLFVCTVCQGRFHHICSGSVGQSDDFNICSAKCLGLQDNNPAPVPELPERPLFSFGTSYSISTTMVQREAKRDLIELSDTELPPTTEKPAHDKHTRYATRANPAISTAIKAASKHTTKQASGASKSLPSKDASTNDSSGKKHIPTSMDTYAPPLIDGQRATVDPRHPNHRKMTLPLLQNEPVVFIHPDGHAQTGFAYDAVESVDVPVTVWYVDANTGKREYADDLSIEIMAVIKETDYLIYSGTRYCVFGPPEGTIGQLLWGSCWLDLVSEASCFKHRDENAFVMYELKRLDVLTVHYDGAASIQVLVLGFLQGSDDSDWKVIGLMNSEDDSAMASPEAMVSHLCYMSMQEVRKELLNNYVAFAEQNLNFESETNPIVLIYEDAMKIIRRHSATPRWLPPRTWRSRSTGVKAGRAKAADPKPCTRCQSMEKQVSKGTVSLV